MGFARGRKVAPTHRRVCRFRRTVTSGRLIALSPASNRGFWWYILLIQLVNASALGALGVIYATVDRRDTFLWHLRYLYLFSEQQQFLSKVGYYVSAGYLFLASWYVYGAVTMIWYSIWRCKYCYGPRLPTALTTRPADTAHATTKDQQPLPHTAIKRAIHWMHKGYTGYQSFGVRGPLFSAGYLLRETFESILQTIQANRSSKSLSNVGINQSYAALIFLNCFTCIFVSHVFRRHPTTKRLVCVLVDLTLDFLWGTVIPFVIMWPYIQTYRARHESGTIVIDFAQLELDYMLILSTSSFVLSVFPFVSSIGTIRGIKTLLSIGLLPVSDDELTSETDAKVGPLVDKLGRNQTNTASVPPATLHTASPSSRLTIVRWVFVGHVLLLSYGIGILLVSLSTLWGARDGELVQCVHRVRPWFVSDVTCVKSVINCTAIGITGREAELRLIFENLNTDVMRSLELSSCPELEIPSNIRRFSKISIISLRDSTLLSWESDAALTSDHFSNLQTLHMHSVSLATLPQGILTPPLPPTLEWINMQHTNADVLVDHVGASWSMLKYLYCDNCNLSAFPEFIRTMDSLRELSLLYNDISQLNDSSIGTMSRIENIWVDGWPISEFPDKLWRLTDHLHEFSFQGTNISFIPEFVRHISGDQLQMDGYGTPVCEEVTLLDNLNCNEIVY